MSTQQLNFLKCLADETRLNIVLLVAKHKELCVCDLIEKLQLSQPKISRHLALLRSSKLLLDRRQGQWVYYSLHPDLDVWANEILEVLVQSKHNQALLNQASITSSCCE